MLNFHRVALAVNSRDEFPPDPRKAQVVEMRFFGGLSVDETAEVLKISPVTVRCDWSTAKVWLYGAMTGRTGHGFAPLETTR